MPDTKLADMSGRAVISGGDLEQRRYRRMMLALTAAGFAVFAELYAVQGTLPELARDFGVSADAAALTVSAATVGLACGVIGWAWLADRIGRLTCMRLAVCSAVALSAASSVAPTLESLLVIRIVMGVALGAVPVLAVAYVHESLSGWRAAKAAMAYISGTTIGGAAGRLIAGPLAPQIGWRMALLAVTAVSVLAVLLFVAIAPKSRAAAISPLPQRTRLWRAFKQPKLLRLYSQSLLLTGCFVGVYNFLAFRLEASPFLLSPGVASLIFLTYAAGTVSARLGGRFLPRWGVEPVALVGIAAMAIGTALTSVEQLVFVIGGLVVLTAGFFLAHACAVAATGATAEPEYRSQAGALYNIGFYAGSGIGGWALGLVFVSDGWNSMVMVMLLVLLVVAISLIPAIVCRQRIPRSTGRTIERSGQA